MAFCQRTKPMTAAAGVSTFAADLAGTVTAARMPPPAGHNHSRLPPSLRATSEPQSTVLRSDDPLSPDGLPAQAARKPSFQWRNDRVCQLPPFLIRTPAPGRESRPLHPRRRVAPPTAGYQPVGSTGNVETWRHNALRCRPDPEILNSMVVVERCVESSRTR
jgi:hypothetical protein